MKQQKKRVIAFTLLWCLVCAMFQGIPGTAKKTKAAKYYMTGVSQMVDGIQWYVYGTLTVDEGTNEKYLSDITSVEILTEKALLAGREVRIPDAIEQSGIRADLVMLGEGMFEETGIVSITLNKYIDRLGDGAFKNCRNLKEVKGIKDGPEVYVGNQCFYGCSQLERADFSIKEAGEKAFYQCEKLKEVSFSSKGDKKLEIGFQAFMKAGVQKLHFAKDLENIIIADHGFSGIPVEELCIPGEVKLGNGSFENCGKLKKVEFLGKVERKDYIGAESMDTAAFGNCFYQEYDGNGQLLEKEVIFHSDAVLWNYQKFPVDIAKKGDFVNCSGLTKVTIKGNAVLPQYTFQNCMNLKELSLEGNVTLGAKIFNNCKKMEKIYFYGNVSQVTGEKESPFSGSHITELHFDSLDNPGHAGVNVNISCDKLKRIYYRSQFIKGTVSDCPILEQIVFLNPALIPGEDRYQEAGYNGLSDKVNRSHDVIGYSSTDTKLRHTENWISSYSEHGVFSNVVYPYSMSAEELHYIGTMEKENIDFTKVIVKHGKYNNLSEKVQVTYTKDGTDLTGYVVDTSRIPQVLVPGTYSYTITYSGQSTIGKVVVEERKPCSLQVQWNENKLTDLVSGQPVSVGDIVSGASITYNDGKTEEISKEKLVMDKQLCVQGENRFEVSLEGFPEIISTRVEDVKKNYVVAIKAQYPEQKKYVGDEINIQDIQVQATYKYPDPQLETMVNATRISTNVLKGEQNEIQVYYGEVSTTLHIAAVPVVPEEVFAIFDQDHFTYIEGQELNKNAILVNVRLNNGKILENVEKTEYEAEILFTSATQLTVQVHYKNLSSDIFYIPVTPKKINHIQVESSVHSAVEGSILPKSIINKILITYSNQKTELLEKDTIDYEKLQLVYDSIVAGVENKIQVKYLGCEDTITIIGLPNRMESIYGEYVGPGVVVGNKVSLEDIKVYGKNTNGTISAIERGFLLERDTIYLPGEENVVIVYYGTMQCEVKVKGIPTVQAPEQTELPIEIQKPANTRTPGENILTPGGSTQVPGESTQTPGGSTQVPGESTQTPGGSAQVPGESTQTPGGSAQVPGESTQTPGGSTQVPGESTQTPGGSTQVPGESTQTPGGSTQVPGGNTEIPGGTTQIPAETLTPGIGTPVVETGNSKEEIKQDEVPTSVVSAGALTIKSNLKGLMLEKKVKYSLYTKKKITIKVQGQGISEIKYQVVAKGKKVKDKNWKKVKNGEITIKKTAKPSIVYLQYKTKAGETIQVHTKGFFVDNKKPSVNLKNGGVYSKGKKIVFKDNGSVKSAKLNGVKIKSGTKLKRKGNYSLLVKDCAGNVTKVKFKVK